MGLLDMLLGSEKEKRSPREEVPEKAAPRDDDHEHEGAIRVSAEQALAALPRFFDALQSWLERVESRLEVLPKIEAGVQAVEPLVAMLQAVARSAARSDKARE